MAGLTDRTSRLMLAAALLPVVLGPAHGQDTQAGDPVSNRAIRALRAKWVEPDAETTDANKIRRYESILREGRQIIREQGQAENLYMVRALMLQATRGLLIVGVDDVDRESVIQLARDIVDSQAPPAWRFEADLLLTQLKLASLEEDDARAESIESFMARYETTDMLAMAVMRATDMADRYGLSKRYKEYLERLKDELLDYEGVGAFLYRHGQRVPQEGRSFRARLPRVEGGRAGNSALAVARGTKQADASPACRQAGSQPCSRPVARAALRPGGLRDLPALRVLSYW